MEGDAIPFNKQMRVITREIHSISDALVNFKLACSLSNDGVWAEGLLVFYEVFRYLEEAMARHPGTPLGLMHVEGMDRTVAFETDLTFFLGPNWKTNYRVRESVTQYLNHLEKLESEDPDLLIAYVYHLYMGLLSGGQILRRKRALFQRFSFFSKPTSPNEGNAVTNFGNHNLRSLKSQIVENINKIATDLSYEQKKKILEESIVVFKLNNEVIGSIEGSYSVLLKKIFQFVTVSVILIYIVCALRS